MKKSIKRFNSWQKEMHKILLNEWDPIGIQDIAEAQDEYDVYIPAILNLLNLEKSQNELFEYLWWVETEHMGLLGNKKKTEIVSKKLKDLFVNYS